MYLLLLNISISLIVLVGWITKDPHVVTLFSDVAIMPLTAFGVLAFSIAKIFSRSNKPLPVFTSLWISCNMIILMMLIFTTSFFDKHIGLVQLFTDSGNMSGEYYVRAGEPSLATISMFILLHFICIYETLVKRDIKIFWLAPIIVASICLIGHILNIPEMYYYQPKSSSGMSFLTGVTFLIFGIEGWMSSDK